MRFLLIFLLAITLLSSGCLGGGGKLGILKPTPVNIEGHGNVYIGFDGYKKEKGFYISISELSENKWIVNEISMRPLKIKSPNEEILFVNESLSYVQPNYELWETTRDNHHFACGIKNVRKIHAYNPCDSKLTSKLVLDVFIDKEKIANIIKQTNLIEEIKKCQNNVIKNAFDFMQNKITVDLQIIDKSGFYKPSDDIFSLIEISKNISNVLKCPMDLNDIKYSISARSISGLYNVDIEPKKNYIVNYNEKGHLLKFSVIVLSKNFYDIYPDYINEDNALRIEFRGKELRFVNKTKNFIQINTISTYYNDKIVSVDLGSEKIELPPLSSTRKPLYEYINYAIKEQSNYWKMTKDIAMGKSLSFGFAIKYHIIEQNIDRTLYKVNIYNLYSVITGTELY